MPKFDFKSQFSTSNITQIFLIFFYWRIQTLNFKSLYLLKWCPIFDSSPLLQFSKFNNFIWLQLIYSQNFFKFCISPLKTPQPVLPYLSALFLNKDETRVAVWASILIASSDLETSIAPTIALDKNPSIRKICKK